MQYNKYSIRFDICNIIDYEKIQEDDELRIFFHTFSEYVKQQSISIKERKLKDNNVIKPNYENLSLLISQLENLGITINKVDLLSTGLYTFAYYDEIIEKIEFNGIKLNRFDLDFLEEKFKNGDENVEIISNAQHRYNLWLKENKGIDKKIQRAEDKAERLIKQTKKRHPNYPNIEEFLSVNVEYNGVKLELSNLKKGQELGLALKNKMEFLNSVTREQELLIIELYAEVIELKTQWHDYRAKLEMVNIDIKNRFIEICQNTLNDMLNTSLVEINLNKIDRKIFKIKIVNFLTGIYSKPTHYDFDIDVVSWFVKSREENLLELYNLTFADLDEMLEVYIEKTKTIGGIN